MSRRRRPVAAFFAVLLVWLTAVAGVRVARPAEQRLLNGDGNGETLPSIAVPRSTVATMRAPARSIVIPQPDLAFLPAPEATTTVVVVQRPDEIALARVRDVQGTASTYDATAPPRLI